MDRITKANMEAFRAEQSLGDLAEADAFELFATFCAVSDSIDEEFDINDVHLGGGDDLGIDGAAVIVNGVLVTSPEEVQDLLDVNGYIDARFIFVQAKTSSTFNGSLMMTLFDGVDEFFEDEPELPMNGTVQNLHEVMQEVYNHSIKFRPKPTVTIHYVTTGQWENDNYLVKKTDKRVAALRKNGLFSAVKFVPMGADELHESYQRSKNSVVGEFQFASRTVLPEIEGVSESYLGVVPATEFLKLIEDQSGSIRKSLFYDNVRDFQDFQNPVNADIRKTLQDSKAQGRFAVLNNGVTIVARGLQTVGNKFIMTDYQVVNGCQTSHVLFHERNQIGPSVYVPLKVIATEDEDVINSVITATNRQTQVTTENIYALGSFQKKLESFFASYPGKKRLYYERRSKQYNAVPGIKKVQIITVSQLIRAFGAMFTDSPHRASRYYQDLQAQVGKGILNEDHKLEPYYVAAYAYYKLEFFFRNGNLSSYYKPSRFHLLMAFRYLAGGTPMPSLTANKAEAYANKLSEILWNDAKALDFFQQAIAVVDEALKEQPLTRDTVKVQTFTTAVKKELGVR
ncbi:AIPR family protein [Plantactinospora solaniradicis]|uniref:AIPR family protein n=1 Tax=Plantactinospora solaniradicis TaxID=1723736 RepID=A0ABW1KJC7_9ACTN